MDVRDLSLAAAKARRLALRMLEASPQGHIGGALSAIDIITVLYQSEMAIDPRKPKCPSRDRFVLSAGHKAMAQYAVLALSGFFPEELLDTYGSLGSRVPGHPDMAKLPGIEANTGALGHGLPIGVGMAMGLRLQKRTNRVFVLLGDGELPEGSNWEGASMAAHHGLSNLVAIVDVNGMQISGHTRDVLNMDPIGAKFRAFGWNTIEIDGHDITAISNAIRNAAFDSKRPTAIVASTIKGRGVEEIEGTVGSHYWKPSLESLETAVQQAESSVQRYEAELI